MTWSTKQNDKKLIDKQGRPTFGIFPKHRRLFPNRGWYLYIIHTDTATWKKTTTIEGPYISRRFALSISGFIQMRTVRYITK